MDMNKVPLQIVDEGEEEERITNKKFSRNAEKVEDIFNSIGFVELIEAPRLSSKLIRSELFISQLMLF